MSDRSRRGGWRWLMVLGIVAVCAAAGALVVAYQRAKAAARGWGELANELPRVLADYDQPVPLPAGSRVVFRDSAVATLQSERRLRLDQTQGGVPIFEGQWLPGSIASQARADTALEGRLAARSDTAQPVIIELLPRRTSASDEAAGLLRLQPFVRGYPVYRGGQ